MDWLLWEIGGRLPYPNFDFWTQLAPTNIPAIEWFRNTHPETLGLSLREKEMVLSIWQADPRSQLTRPLFIKRCTHPEASWPFWTEESWPFWTEESWPFCIEEMARSAAKLIWPHRLMEREFAAAGTVVSPDGTETVDISNLLAVARNLLEEKIASWSLTDKQGHLFRILESLHETKPPARDNEPGCLFPNAGVSEAYLASKLWGENLNVLGASKATKILARLRRLQADLNEKLLLNRTNLSVLRPRPKALSLVWHGPGAEANRDAADGDTVACMIRLRILLSSMPGQWLPPEIAERTLKRSGFTSADIAEAASRLGLEHHEPSGSASVRTWRLPQAES
jgi:hypothetical protein